MKSVVNALVVALLAMFGAGAAEDGGIWLTRDGRAQCAIVHGSEDGYAGERLQRWFRESSGAELPVSAVQSPPPDASCVIVAGSAASSPLIRDLAEALGLAVDADSLTEQAYRIRTAHHQGRDWLILAGGGADGVRHAVADLIFTYAVQEDGDIRVPALDTHQEPRFKHRWLWNWDHRMDWGGPGRVGNVMGGGGTFSKEPEAFLIDFKRCVDYMADHKFNGLIIWGFLRDTHGGIAASQELCTYAARRGVRILPGVGTSGYAGYYFEGAHPYNAAVWLAKHPELRAIDEKGKSKNAPCPSKKANQDWLDEGAKWLFDTFDIGGVNLEMGDFFVCHCEDCQRARAAIDSDEPDYYKDMAISHSVTLETMHGLDPAAWLSYATYTGYTAGMMDTPPKFLSMIPDYALCQWTLTHMAKKWPADIRPMAKRNIGYLHWCNSSTHTEEDFYLEEIRAICQNAAGAGFEGLDTYGELSPDNPNVELFYLAWEAFLWNPDSTVDDFVSGTMARLYGGPEPARALLTIIPLIRTAKQRATAENLVRARAMAEGARESAAPSGRLRWDRLLAYVDRHEKALRERIAAQEQAEADARKGKKLDIASVKASDEDPQKGWYARNAVDGSVEEPAGYWLTKYCNPKSAWLELTLAEPAMVSNVSLFHQLDPRHYRSLDYTISIRTNGAWTEVAAVKDNDKAGWTAHTFDAVLADAARLDITRSAYGNRMGIGEMELRMAE